MSSENFNILLAPAYLTDLVVPLAYVPARSLRSVEQNLLAVKRYKLERYRPLSRRLDRCDRVIQNESRDPFGGNVYYVTMQITFLTRKFRNGERNLHYSKITLFITKGELLRIGIFVKLLVNSRRQNGVKF